MAVTIKTKEEQELMREAGWRLAKVHETLRDFIRPGITTLDIDRYGEELIRELDGIPSFLGYEGYPASICVSVNDEVVHGIPSDDRVLEEGDIVSLDAGLIYKGWQSDAARTWAVGKISAEAQDLIAVTEASFYEGLRYAKAGCRLYEISAAIGGYANDRGYGVVEALTGHGIGTALHEDPMVPNFAQKARGMRLVPGMTIAVEPMINIGTKEVLWEEDEWTVVTADGSLSAHYENTILITDGEPELFTLNSR